MNVLLSRHFQNVQRTADESRSASGAFSQRQNEPTAVRRCRNHASQEEDRTRRQDEAVARLALETRTNFSIENYYFTFFFAQQFCISTCETDMAGHFISLVLYFCARK